MRTLKTLSLVLALVLCFGLVGTAFAAPANFEGYTDADKIGDVYTEAADVLMGIGVIEGKTDTTVDPTGTFTREQAAKIIASMLLGKEAAGKLTASAAPFADVAANRWSAGFISYCAEQGIVSGVGNGNFNPTGTLTGYQFAKMLLAAVGYNANSEYEGASWSINVARDGIQKGVFDDDLSAATSQPITRQQAMLMAFNTLTGVERVVYSDLLKSYVGFRGVLLGALGTPVAPSFLAENFGLGAAATNLETGEDAHQWKIGARTVSEVYPDGTVAGEDKDIGSKTAAQLARAYVYDAASEVYFNGRQVATPATGAAIAANSPAGSTAKFIDTDDDGDVDQVIILQEYLALVTAVTGSRATVTVYNPAAAGGNFVGANVNGVSGLAKDDYVLIVPKQAAAAIAAAHFAAPISIEKVEPLKTKLDEYANDQSSVTYGSKAYDVAANSNLLEPVNSVIFTNPYYVFMNSANYVIGVTASVAAAPIVPDFMYVVDSASSAAVNTLLAQAAAQYKVKGVLMDGTAGTWDVVISKTGTVRVNGADVAVGNAAAPGPLAAGSVYAYTMVDGKITSLTLTVSGAAYGATGYKATWTATAGDYLNVSAGNALVKVLAKAGAAPAPATDPFSAAFAAAKLSTTTTQLAVSGADANPGVTTYAGYEKFPGTATQNKNFEIGAAAGQCAAIVTIEKIGTAPAADLITNILVVSQAAAAPIAPPPVAAAFTGVITNRAGYNGADVPFYQFMKADGTKIEYQLDGASPVPAAAGDVFTIALDLNNCATLTAIPAANTNQNVDTKTDTYIVVGGTVYYTDGVPVLDIKPDATTGVRPFKAGTLAKNQGITYILNATTGQPVAIFIVA